MPSIAIPVVKIHQNIGDFYVGVITAKDLYSISTADRVRLENLEIPKYAGYQRALVGARVAEIRDYVDTPKSTFPNAIIINLDSEYIESWDNVDGIPALSLLTIRREEGIVQIIDGQHRAAALDTAPNEFQVLVSIFIDLNSAQCAEIFAKINSTQRAVNPSIAFQLFGYSETRSPQRTAHEIADILSTTEGSPFYRKLKMLGTKDEWSRGSLSQATFAKELMGLYTRSWVRDEYRLLRGQALEDEPKYPLRKYFIEGNDKRILEIVWRFFVHVAQTWPDQWNDDTGMSILPKTTGYSALMAILRLWLLSPRATEVLNDAGVGERFAQIAPRYMADGRRFVRDNFPAGNQGIIRLRDSLIQDLGFE